MTEEHAQSVVPKLRFPEFEREWAPKSLGEVCDMQAGKFVPAADIQDVLRDGLYPCFGGNGLRGYTATHTHYGRLPLIGRQGALCGNVTLALGKFYATEHAVVAIPKSGIAVDWLYYTLDRLNLNRFATGQAQPGLSVDVLEKVCCSKPPREEEQQTIADCLSSIDVCIGTETRKLDALKTHKQGLMQELFPAEGQRLPRLRFPEFEGEWEVCDLGRKTVKVGSGVTPSGGQQVYKAFGRPFVRSQNVGWGALLLDDVAFIDDETHASFSSTELVDQDVLLNITGASIGRSAIADSRVTGGNVNQHVCIIRPITGLLDPIFLNQFLISQLGQHQIDSFQAGGNRQGLNFAQIRSLNISLPPAFAEQQRISACLSSLDDLMVAQARKIAALQQHKKGLMHGLFPAMDA